MKWKLACADFTFPLLSHGDALSLIAMLGVKGVDVGLFEDRSHLQPSREFRNVTRSAKALKKQLSDRGLHAADVFLQVAADGDSYAINQPSAARRKKARDWYQRTLDYCAACDGRHVTISPGVYFKGHGRDRCFRQACEELAWRVEVTKPYGVLLGVEPHVGSIAPRPKSAIKLVNSVPGLTFTLDYTHFTRAGIPDREVEPLLAHASHFHVRGGAKGRLQTSFRDNTVDYKRVLQVMAKTGYKGYIGIEYVWTVWERCNEVDNLSETILYRDFLRKHMK